MQQQVRQCAHMSLELLILEYEGSMCACPSVDLRSQCQFLMATHDDHSFLGALVELRQALVGSDVDVDRSL